MNRTEKTIQSRGIKLEKPHNLNTAPADIILSLPDFTEQQLKNFLSYRQDTDTISDVYELDRALTTTPDRVKKLYEKAEYETQKILDLDADVLENHLSVEEIEKLKEYFGKNNPVGIDSVLRAIEINSDKADFFLNIGFRFYGPGKESTKTAVNPGSTAPLSVYFVNNFGEFLSVDDPKVVGVYDPDNNNHISRSRKMSKQSDGVYVSEFSVPKNAETGVWKYDVEGKHNGNTIVENFTFEVKSSPEVSSINSNNVCTVVGNIKNYGSDNDNDEPVRVHFHEKQEKLGPYTQSPVEAITSENGRFTVELIHGAKVRFDLPGTSKTYITTVPEKAAVDFDELIKER